MQNQNVTSTIFPFIAQNVLTNEECASLIEVCDAQGQPGMIKADGGKKNEISNSIRRSSIVRLVDEKWRWLYERMVQTASAANETYQYDMNNAAIEALQVAAYDSANKGTYGWHMDMGPGTMNRKFGISVSLNPSSEYKGGDFQVNYAKTETLEQIQGQAIVFPSYLMHRVTPVTKGTRYSLVAWVLGRPFR